MITSITNSPDYGPERVVTQPAPVEPVSDSSFMELLDRMSNSVSVSQEVGCKMVKDLSAWMLNPLLTSQVAPEPAAPGVFGPYDDYETAPVSSTEPMKEGLLG